MPELKLYYFHARGRGEPARLCFAAGGIPYEDIRFTNEEYKEKKKEGLSPTGLLPMLVVDGKKVTESLAIMRYAARLAGLVPSDAFEIALCDMVVDVAMDFFNKMVAFYYEKDEERKNKLVEEFKSTHVPNFISLATKLLKENNEGKGFFVGNELSYADIIVFYTIDMIEPLKKALADHSDLNAYFERVGNVPNIKKWIESRPKTDL